jgi:hypothetical protein
MADAVNEKNLAQRIEQVEDVERKSHQPAGNTRRIPIPTGDPNDPLNFGKVQKLGILVSCCWFSIFSLFLVGGLGPIIPVFMDLYIPQGKTGEQIVSLSTYPSVAMAAGKFS